MSATLYGLVGLSADEILGLWEHVERVRRHRAADPELYEALRRRIDNLEDDVLADELRAELDTAHPAVVLEVHLEEFIDLGRPALGAFPRREHVDVPSIEEWYRADPCRLDGLVEEMCRFSDDLPKVVQAALDFADHVHIDADVADKVILGALRRSIDGRHAG